MRICLFWALIALRQLIVSFHAGKESDTSAEAVDAAKGSHQIVQNPVILRESIRIPRCMEYVTATLLTPSAFAISALLMPRM